MTSAFGGQRSIQLSYGCKPNGANLAEGVRAAKATKEFSTKKKARRFPGPSSIELVFIALDQLVAKQ